MVDHLQILATPFHIVAQSVMSYRFKVPVPGGKERFGLRVQLVALKK